MGLTLVRHPRVDARGLCYGRHDPPLQPGWGADARRLIPALSACAQIISSPAPRAMVLAEALAKATELPLSQDARLQELDFGAWEGRAWAEIPRAESDPWANDPERIAPPGGETFETLRARVGHALCAHQDAVIVTHAGPIRAAWILGGVETFASAFARPVPYVTALPCPDLPCPDLR